MSQAAVFITCQMPDRSGLPSGVRPRAPPAWLVAGAWPPAASDASQRRAATSTIGPMNQCLNLIGLLSGLRRAAIVGIIPIQEMLCDGNRSGGHLNGNRLSDI